MQDIIRLSQENFNLDLETCLTILLSPTDATPYYVCEYITPGLYKRIVNVLVIN